MYRLLLSLILLVLASSACAAPPRVVASIMPLHAIVASVMSGVAAPELLLPARVSPHGYAMRPSEAKLLDDAELVFWVGPELETFLARPLAALAAGAQVVMLAEASGMRLLPYRDHFDDDAHGDDEHGGGHDPHLWLSPANARRIAAVAAAHLSRLDPDNGTVYRENAARFDDDLRALETRLRNRLAPVSDIPFMVFHDAYRYFEEAMGLNNRGAISPRPALSPGVERMRNLRRAVAESGVRCIFSEPQFPDSLVHAVAGESGVRIARVDPLGVDVDPGAGAYQALIGNFADTILDCLDRE